MTFLVCFGRSAWITSIVVVPGSVGITSAELNQRKGNLLSGLNHCLDLRLYGLVCRTNPTNEFRMIYLSLIFGISCAKFVPLHKGLTIRHRLYVKDKCQYAPATSILVFNKHEHIKSIKWI